MADFSSISATSTWAPYLANNVAIDSPIPLPAPVTTTFFDFNLSI